MGIPVADIIAGRVKEIPSIRYNFNGKSRVHFPDIYIPTKNMLVEVKSTYTYNKDIDKNLAKHQACKAAGFEHIILVINDNHIDVDVID